MPNDIIYHNEEYIVFVVTTPNKVKTLEIIKKDEIIEKELPDIKNNY